MSDGLKRDSRGRLSLQLRVIHSYTYEGDENERIEKKEDPEMPGL